MKIELTDQEVFVVGKALALMPYGEVAGLIVNIQNQINSQKDNDGDTSGKEPTEVE